MHPQYSIPRQIAQDFTSLAKLVEAPLIEGKDVQPLIEGYADSRASIWAPNTLGYVREELVRYMKPLIDLGRPLDYGDFQSWWDGFVVAYSSGSAQRAKMNLSSVFGWGVEQGLVTYNPFPLLKDSPTFRHKATIDRARPVKTFTPEEFRRLVAVSKPPLLPLIIQSYWTAMAIADCALLKWESISWERGTITYIRHKMRRLQRPIEVPMAGPVKELIKAQLDANVKTSSFLAPYVWPDAAEIYLRAPPELSFQFKRACKLAKIEDKPFHSLRKSAVSRWVSQPDGDLITVSHMSGHSDFATLKKYVKPSLSKRRALVDAPDIE